MKALAGDFLVGRLKAWGVRRLFGYPGDGINGILGALERAGNEPAFVQTRHEEMAAFMACAHAKFTGEAGVCLATSGPGAVHLLNGLYDAQLDHQPVVAIVGQAARMSLGGSFQQEIDLQALFKDVAHEYVTTVTSPFALRHAIDRAFRIALSQRCVTCVIVPKDVQEGAYEDPPHEHGAISSGAGYASPRVIPQEAELRRAAEVLNAGSRVAMLIGAGALRAASEVTEIADLLGAGVAKALLGKAALPDDLPFVTGSIGLLGTRPSYELMRGCDTLLMVGSSFPYVEALPAPGRARGVQIDVDARMLSIRYPMEVALNGDSAETLRALRPLLRRKADRKWRQEIEENVRAWKEELAAQARTPAKPLHPAQVFDELSKRLPDGAIVACDTGSVTTWFARNLALRSGMMASVSGNLATMGPGVPYAIAAKLAYPERPVFALVGDGAFQMNGMAELITVARSWREWKDPRFVVLVVDNGDLNMVSWEERAMSGDPKFPASQDLPQVKYADFASSLGLRALRVDRSEDVAAAWETALAADRPCLVDAVVDPAVPMLPPHVTPAQAAALAKSLLKGDPDARRVIAQTLKELLPGKR